MDTMALVGNGNMLIITSFVELFHKAGDSVAAQDQLLNFYKKVGILADSSYEITDEEAWDLFDAIRHDETLTPEAKGAYLSALDVTIQNHHPRGLAAPILRCIATSQAEIVMRKQYLLEGNHE